MPFVSVSRPSPSEVPVLHFLGGPRRSPFPPHESGPPAGSFAGTVCQLRLFPTELLPPPADSQTGCRPRGWPRRGRGQEMAHIFFVTASHRALPVASSTPGRGAGSSSLASHTHTHVHTLCWPAQGTGRLRAEHTAPLDGTSGWHGVPCCPFCDVWFLLSSLPGEE